MSHWGATTAGIFKAVRHWECASASSQALCTIAALPSSPCSQPKTSEGGSCQSKRSTFSCSGSDVPTCSSQSWPYTFFLRARSSRSISASLTRASQSSSPSAVPPRLSAETVPCSALLVARYLSRFFLSCNTARVSSSPATWPPYSSSSRPDCNTGHDEGARQKLRGHVRAEKRPRRAAMRDCEVKAAATGSQGLGGTSSIAQTSTSLMGAFSAVHFEAGALLPRDSPTPARSMRIGGGG